MKSKKTQNIKWSKESIKGLNKNMFTVREVADNIEADTLYTYEVRAAIKELVKSGELKEEGKRYSGVLFYSKGPNWEKVER